MEILILILLIVVIIIEVVQLFIKYMKQSDNENNPFFIRMDHEVNKINPNVRDEFSRNRDEIQKNSKELREELPVCLNYWVKM